MTKDIQVTPTYLGQTDRVHIKRWDAVVEYVTGMAVTEARGLVSAIIDMVINGSAPSERQASFPQAFSLYASANRKKLESFLNAANVSNAETRPSIKSVEALVAASNTETLQGLMYDTTDAARLDERVADFIRRRGLELIKGEGEAALCSLIIGNYQLVKRHLV